MTERVRVADDFDAIRANMERLRREEGRAPGEGEVLPDGRPTAPLTATEILQRQRDAGWSPPPSDTYIGCFPVDPEWCPF